MTSATGRDLQARRVLIATDRSPTAELAVRWAARFAGGQNAELLLVQVLLPPSSGDGAEADATRATALVDLQRTAVELAGPRGRGLVVTSPDPTQAILAAIESENADVVVVGNVGMGGRKQFLLGNIPNQISHNARCTIIIVNTAAAAGAAQPTSRQATATPVIEGRLLRRALRIARVLAKAGLRDLFKKTPPAGAASAGGVDTTRLRARQLKEALEELGPTFAKLGQILSTRPDLVPPEFIEELANLQEGVTPLTEAQVVSAMERELRVPWEDVFASIDPKPLAAGTIAQVHRATLETGERVVVKVQRPNAEQDILQDLALLEMFAKKAADRPAFRQVFDIPAVIRNLSESLRKELDFRQEAGNIHRMRGVLAPFSRLAVPGVYDQYSTARLLTMEEVQGVPVRQAPPGPARTQAARQLLESFYTQVFSEGFFHADPHPGNLKWWNDKIYFLDLGMVGHIEPEERQLMLMLLLAFSQKDVPFLTEAVLSLAGQDQQMDQVDRASFEEELGQFVARYRGDSLRDVHLGAMLQEMTTISVRHHIRMPASMALVGKAFAQMQGVTSEMDPTLDPFSVAGSFVLKSTLGQVTSIADPKKLFYEVQKGAARLGRFITAVERLTGATPGRRLEVNFRGTERLEQTIAQGVKWLALALVGTGTLVAVAATAISTRVPWGVPAAIGGVGFALCLLLLALGAPLGRER